MPGTAGEVRVKGLKELDTVLKHAPKDLRKEVLDTFKDVAEPVRLGAERLAYGHGISGRLTGLRPGDKWGQMRIGFSSRDAVVYVAPRQRGSNSWPMKRRNFGPLLLDEAMIPALEENTDLIEKRVGDALDDLAHFWRFTG